MSAFEKEKITYTSQIFFGNNQVNMHETRKTFLGIAIKGLRFESVQNGTVVYRSKNIIEKIGPILLNRERTADKTWVKAKRRARKIR